MKTLKYLAFGFAAAFGLVAACGDDTGGANTSSSSNDDGGGGEDGSSNTGAGAGSSGTEATTGTNTGSTGSNTTTSGTGGDCTPADDENTAELCDDGCDNDGDGFVDCGDANGENSDFGCSAFCRTPGPPAENSNVTCSDGVDNDDDGMIDCDDPGCADRRACSDDPITGESTMGAPNTVCNDGINNDGNTGSAGQDFTDCGDNSCSFNWEATVCQDLPREQYSNELCSNGLDDDLDGLVDCDDPGCADPETGEGREGIVVCGPNAVLDEAQWPDLVDAVCGDGLNNDGNTGSNGQPFTDCEDRGCSWNPHSSVCPGENDDTTCADGVDNDDNGYVDCADFGCSQNPRVTVCADALENTFAKCTDGVDNDGNGWTDCDDNNCKSNRAACDFPSDN